MVIKYSRAVSNIRGIRLREREITKARDNRAQICKLSPLINFLEVLEL